MKNIFNYTDYRKFLADEVQKRKEQNAHFTYRYIAQHLKLASPGFFNWVISGKRKLPETLIPNLVTLFKLDDLESSYFSLLVRYNHCTEIVEREEFFEKLSVLKKKHTACRLTSEQHELFSKWHYLAIHELLHIYTFKDDYRALASALCPKIRINEAREAIEKLEKLGFITRDENGFFKPVETVLSTGGVWESELITNLQVYLADLGKNSILTLPKKERNISNVTVCLSEKSKTKIVKEIIALRQRILALSESDQEADTVYQCNFHIFPISLPAIGRKR
jgi:uncharacterized protein (TIGR02147 family)